VQYSCAHLTTVGVKELTQSELYPAAVLVIWLSELVDVAVQSSDRELWTFVSLNLALVYLPTNRQEDFMTVLSTVEPERLSNTSYVMCCDIDIDLVI